MGLFIMLMSMAGLIAANDLWRRAAARRRTEELQAVAAALGWSFAPTQPLDAVPGLERFSPFREGRGPAIRNFMAGRRGDTRAAVFDFHYTTGHGKSSHRWRRTVLYLWSERLALPAFSVWPEGVLDRIEALFGAEDIDFPDRPRFSSACKLLGKDEAAVRELFGPEVTAFFEENPELCAEGAGSDLFVWRAPSLAEGAEVPGLAEGGAELLDRLLARGGVAAGATPAGR
ncbi:MAG TPA: hypothetical protein VGR37_07750 [Longimicrobiaceae bacterium]|nr:hypothetical protein [Longimicrobiaceae bacterium]